jgi:hypothetical protein
LHVLAIATVAAAVLLAGCQQSSTVRDDTFGHYRQLQGASLVLKQALTVPAGKARVFLQDGREGQGRAIVGGGFDHYRTHCAFEIDEVRHAGFTIEPGTFRIERVQHSVTPVVMARPVQVASLLLADGLDGEGTSAYYEGYHFWLSAPGQPGLRRLSCYGAYAEPPDLYPPTLGEIRAALGGIADIVL